MSGTVANVVVAAGIDEVVDPAVGAVVATATAVLPDPVVPSTTTTGEVGSSSADEEGAEPVDELDATV